MNLKLDNAHYTNVYGTKDNIRDNPKCFDVIVTDLDNEINEGKPFPYTYVDNADDSDSKVKQYIKSKLNELDIAYYYSDSEIKLAIYEYKYVAQRDIDDDCNTYINKYDAVFFNNDIYTYDIDSINVINSIIDCYKSQLDNNKLTKDQISHKFISATNIQHELSYDQLIELRNLMVMRYSDIKLHARELKDKIVNAETVDEIKQIGWDLWNL